MKIIPDAYYKSIYDIDYDLLKRKNYHNIIFDVDNTLIPYTENKVRKENVTLIKKLKNMGFNVIIMSNSNSNRVNSIINDLKIIGYVFSLKPLKKNYKKIMKKYNKDECIFIGDQFMTDVLGAKRNNLKVILVDRIEDIEPIFTKFWRFFEKKIIKKYEKNNLFKTNKYYNNL